MNFVFSFYIHIFYRPISSYLINFCGPGWKNISFPRIHHLLNFFESQFNKCVFLSFQFKFHLNLGCVLHFSAFTCACVHTCVCVCSELITAFLSSTNHNLAGAHVQLEHSWELLAGHCVCVFVELWACQAAQGRHHMIVHFMNVQVKGAKCYALQNKFTKGKESVLLKGYAHEKRLLRPSKGHHGDVLLRFNFQILHWQWNLISCLIRFICNEKEREVLMITGTGTSSALWSGISESHLFLCGDWPAEKPTSHRTDQLWNHFCSELPLLQYSMWHFPWTECRIGPEIILKVKYFICQ